MSFKDLANKAKHMMVEEDEASTTHKQEVKATISSAPLQSAVRYPIMPDSSGGMLGSPFVVPTAVIVDENVYKRLLERTNFDSTEVGKVIHRYFDALEDSGLDTSMRFKSAMSQASKLDGVTSDKILAAFDTLKLMLQANAEDFSKSAKANENKEIVTRQNRLQEIANQISRLEQERTQVTAELSSAQNDHSSTVQQFNLAAQRRSTEIDNQKMQFTALLQH
jgi:hypothetical protein